jgi:hypothetical protein
MSQGPQVLDMEYQEPDRLEPGPGGPILLLLQRLHLVSNNNIHPIGLVLQQQWVLLHEVMSPGVMVCVTLILKTFEYVHLILLLLTCAWTLCLSTCLHLGGMTGFPSKLVPMGFELPLGGVGGFMKGHRPFPPYLPLFIFFPLIHPIHWFGHWVCQASKGLYLTLWEEGAKGLEGKSSWQKIKSKKNETFRCFAQGSPRKP